MGPQICRFVQIYWVPKADAKTNHAYFIGPIRYFTIMQCQFYVNIIGPICTQFLCARPIPSENYPHLTVTGKIDQTGGIQHLYTRFFYRFNVFLDANTLNTGHRCLGFLIIRSSGFGLMDQLVCHPQVKVMLSLVISALWKSHLCTLLSALGPSPFQAQWTFFHYCKNVKNVLIFSK